MAQLEPNTYSHRWFKFFHAGIDGTRTARETEFVCACAPLPCFRTVADLCCGMGRHARALCSRGYSVTGSERDAVVVAKARELGGGPSYIQADIRDYQFDIHAYDFVIIMSQSFGHFDEATNRDLLRRVTTGVRQGGRLILDLWNPEFFAGHQGQRDFDLADGIVRETKRIEGGRLFVHLAYPGGDHDDFEWQLFTPSEMLSLADTIGLALIVCCTDFDSTIGPCPSKPRIQFVLERRSE